ncbi:MAG TPA: hypothetical protein VEK57_25070 [Thermoanaerobaculia bacterium]|nr:hypothetical protein [Thermoanaerobaculia bacterium]
MPDRYTLDSFRESNQTSPNFTQLVITVPTATEPTPHKPEMTVRYFDGAWTDVFSAGLDTLFHIALRRFDLMAREMDGTQLNFTPVALPKVTHLPAERKIVLEYTTNGISVWVTINAAGNAARRSNFGWINFDIRHTFPQTIRETPASYAWEEHLLFPIFGVDIAAKEYETITGPLQFRAIYKKAAETATERARVSGVAIHVEDERSNATGAYVDAPNKLFVNVLRNSIHLRTTLSGSESVIAPEYALSGGDDYGFGGNRMVYRLRGFNARGVCPGAPVDWHDVMAIYRGWLQDRFVTFATNDTFFYRKIPSIAARPLNAASDEMGPHIVISNFGLDGGIDAAADPQLAKWLEMHPLREDNSPGANPSFFTLVRKLRSMFPVPPKIDVQPWGFEKAGFYQFLCGHPPLSDLLYGPGTFRNAVERMKTLGAATTLTTDPLNVLFNRGRYAGHIRWKGGDWSQVRNHLNWEPYIRHPFPAAFRDGGCPVTVTKIGGKQFNRVWVVEPSAAIERQPVSGHVRPLADAQRTDENGTLSQVLPVIGTGLYRGNQKQLCPTAEVARIYLNDWVRPLAIEKGVRVLEFMKHSQGGYHCYRTDHQHIVPHPHVPAPPTLYSNVIGHGSWHARRLQCMFHDAHELGKVFDNDGHPSFRLQHEFLPSEALLPYVNQTYSGFEMADFVYSHLVTPMISAVRGEWGIHPGYREERKVPGPAPIRPEWMLLAGRDAVAVDPAKTDEEAAAIFAQQVPFATWKTEAVNYFNTHFKVAEFGIAPRGYPIGPPGPGALVPWNPQAPLAPTNPPTFTYNRCVQQAFNLRAEIFETGRMAVRGVRLAIPSTWLETPTDYDDEALLHAVRAVQMQRDGKAFFRLGRMLGETRITKVAGAPLKKIGAWQAVRRPFSDVTPLVGHIAVDDPYLGSQWRTRPLRDFNTRGWDKESYPLDNIVNTPTIAKQIEHRVWQATDGRLLYVFANVGNTRVPVEFLYSRGLEGTTQAPGRQRTITIYGPGATAPAPEGVWLGQTEMKLVMPARSFASVVIAKP